MPARGRPSNNPLGRPAKYDAASMPEAAKSLAQAGATQEEIASAFGITSRQLRTWRAQYPEFRIALDAGNEVFDTRVERALAERAIGFYETWEEDTPRPVYHACTPGSVHASRIATTLCTHRLVHASRIARFARQLLHLLRLEQHC